MRLFTNALVFAAGPTDPAIRPASRLAGAHRTTITIADVLETAAAYLRPLLPRQWKVPTLLRAHPTAELAAPAR
jgi:hypothetical protein